MKIRLGILTCIFFLSHLCALHAQESILTTTLSKRDELIQNKLYPHHFVLAYTAHSWEYREENMRDQGVFYGLKAGTQYVLKSRYMGSASIEYYTGKAQHEGPTESGERRRYAARNLNSELAADILLGVIFVPHVEQEFSIAPYLGPVFRSHFYTKDADSNVAFHRQFDQNYLALGTVFKKGVSAKSYLGVDLRYAFLLSAKMTERFSDNGKEDDLEIKKTQKGQMYQFSLEYVHQLPNLTSALGLRPFYRSSKIADMRVGNAESGLELGVRF